MCFTCWLRLGFSHFINMDSLSFTWYLVAAESRISKQSGAQDALQNSELCRCFKESITALYDHIENDVGTKFENYQKKSFGIHNPSYCQRYNNELCDLSYRVK